MGSSAHATISKPVLGGTATRSTRVRLAVATTAPARCSTRPSQPGKQLDGDYITSTRADPALTERAQTVISN